MSKNALEVLFDSRVKVKILKFLFRNIGLKFTAKEMASRIQELPSLVKKEIRQLVEIGLLKNV